MGLREALAILVKVGTNSAVQLATTKITTDAQVRVDERVQTKRDEALREAMKSVSVVAQTSSEETVLGANPSDSQDARVGQFLKENAPSLHKAILDGKVQKE